MTRTILMLTVFLGLFITSDVNAQTHYYQKALKKNIAVSKYVYENRWEPEKLTQAQYIEPNTEVDMSILFLKSVNVQDRPFIRFFTTYSIPPKMRIGAVNTLSFVLHSMAAAGDNSLLGYHPLATTDNGEWIPLHLVPGSNTLWWIDVRDFNWTVSAFEKASQFDPYFVEPVVDKVNNQLLITLVGTPNVVMRADWFVSHATDTMKQKDRGFHETIQDILLYAQQDHPPKTQAEWRAIWTGITNLDTSRAMGNGYGTVVSNSKVVARGNRQLFGYETETGYLYESYDTLNHSGQRDFVEGLLQYRGLPPVQGQFDAGESFATNALGMQVYSLYSDDGRLLNDANAGVARHISDISGDVRVRTSTSCMDCHSAGPLPAENFLRDVIQSGVRIHIQNDDDANRIERVFLRGQFNKSVVNGQKYFADALMRVNGLKPEENGFNFLTLTQYYNNPVTLSTAALECGLTTEEFVQRLRGKVTGRLSLLIARGTPIPRDIWDSIGGDGIPGAFQQTMFVLNGTQYAQQQNFSEFMAVDEKSHEEIKQEQDVVVQQFVVGLNPVRVKFWVNGVRDGWRTLVVGKRYATTGNIKIVDGVEFISVSSDTGSFWVQTKHVSEVRFE